MRSCALVVLCGCAGTLGHPGERAPAGIAFCEPVAVRIETLDARGAVARSLTARCTIDGTIELSEAGARAGRVERYAARKLWERVAALAPLGSCPAGTAHRFRVTIVGDDADDVATCALGADPRFDALLGAIFEARRRAREPVRWMDIPVVARR